MKDTQIRVLKPVAVENKDVLAVLPSGHGKYLIYQILPSVFDYLECLQTPSKPNSVGSIVSPSKPNIHDQIEKLSEKLKLRFP